MTPGDERQPDGPRPHSDVQRSYFARETRRETVRDLTLAVDRARSHLRLCALAMLPMAVLGGGFAHASYAPALKRLGQLAPDATATHGGHTAPAGALIADMHGAIVFAIAAPVLAALHFLWLRARALTQPVAAFTEAIVAFVVVHVGAALVDPMTLAPFGLLALRAFLLFSLVGGRIAAAARAAAMQAA